MQKETPGSATPCEFTVGPKISIGLIPDNGQPVLSALEPQLVGSTGMGSQFQEGQGRRSRYQVQSPHIRLRFKGSGANSSDRVLPPFHIHPIDPFLTRDTGMAKNQSLVDFLDFPIAKDTANRIGHLLVQGNQDQARSRRIEPVEQPDTLNRPCPVETVRLVLGIVMRSQQGPTPVFRRIRVRKNTLRLLERTEAVCISLDHPHAGTKGQRLN